jgi:hypothetical protein
MFCVVLDPGKDMVSVLLVPGVDGRQVEVMVKYERVDSSEHRSPNQLPSTSEQTHRHPNPAEDQYSRSHEFDVRNTSYKAALQPETPIRPMGRPTPSRQDARPQWTSIHKESTYQHRLSRWSRLIDHYPAQVDPDGYTIVDRQHRSHQEIPRPHLRHLYRGGQHREVQPTVGDDEPVAMEVESPRPNERPKDRKLMSPVQFAQVEEEGQVCVRISPRLTNTPIKDAGILPLLPLLLPSHNLVYISNLVDINEDFPPLPMSPVTTSPWSQAL